MTIARRSLIILAAALGVAGCGRGSASSLSPPTQKAVVVTHRLDIQVSDSWLPGTGPDALWGGATLTVSNQSGTIVAADTIWPPGSTYGFRVPLEPFYTVAISGVGHVTFSLSQIQGRAWTLTLEVS